MEEKGKGGDATVKPLDEYDEKYRNLFENAQIGMYRTRLDGSAFLDVNRKFCEILGFSREELIGAPARIRWADSEDRDRMLKLLKEQGGTLYGYEARVVAKNGEVRNVIASTVLSPEEGVLEGTMYDITERKQAERKIIESESRFRALVETMNDGLAMQDMAGLITYVNPRLCEMLGYTREEIMGKPWKGLFDSEGLRILAEQMAKRKVGQRSTYEIPWRTKDGRTLNTLISGNPIHDDAGNLKGSFGVITDITDRKRAEEGLRETNEYLDNLFNYANAPILVWDIQFRITRFNHAFERLTGRKAGEVIGKTLDVLFPPDKADSTMDFIRKTQGGERWETVEIGILNADGTVRTVLWNSAPILANDGKTQAATIAQGQDITERKRAEEDLRNSEAKYRTLVENIPQKIFMKDINFRWVSINERFARDLGIRPGEAVGKQDIDFFPKDLADKYRADDERIITTGNTEDIEEKYLQEGKEFWVHTVKTPVKDENGVTIGVLGIFWDITERKKADAELARYREHLEELIKERTAELRASEQLFRTLADFTYDWEYWIDPERKMVYVSPSCERISGYTPAEFAGDRDLIERIVHPDDREKFLDHRNSYHLGGKRFEVHEFEFRIISKAGESRWINHLCRPIVNEKGEYLGRRASNRDITERKKLEEDYRVMVQTSIDGFWVTDLQGRFLDVNEAYCSLIGYSREELLGMRISDVEAVERPEETAAHIEKIMRTGHDRFETRHRCRDGRIIDVEVSVNRVSTGGGRLFVFLRDVTERKRAEEEKRSLNTELSRRATELEAANRELEAFSYSVSHDLRAPLRIIDGFSLALLEDYSEKLDDTAADHLRRVRTSTQRMAQLIDDLLKLSRVTRAEMRIESVNLGPLARSVERELGKAQPGRDVELTVQEGLNAEGDSRLLRVVLENLLGNSWKFTGKHPAARVTLGKLEKDGERVFFVKDDGAGFDMAYVGKLFAPFQRLHSTEEFPGTGIGLATVQRIVSRHGGRVWAEGEVEKGATFYFTLKAKDAKADNGKVAE